MVPGLIELCQKNQEPIEIVPNQNLSFPIGTIVSVEKLYQVLKCGEIFDETKKKAHRGTECIAR